MRRTTKLEQEALRVRNAIAKTRHRYELAVSRAASIEMKLRGLEARAKELPKIA